MYFDNSIARRKAESKKKFEELKKQITSLDKDNKINEFYLAFEHISDMEDEIVKLKTELKKYRTFFALLTELTPKSSKSSDIIG